ncbi:MAG TPA: twin-arginine translocase TatA/TatE family subunit [Longimicrobiales bacterium]|nr:twin-arginine translocase TatA/TatE family subunit [Longimicrobiales bacterium]
MPFNLSPVELLFVLAVLLLLFGAKKLPELGSGLGKGIREFKRSIKDVNDEISRPDPPPGQIEDPASRPQVKPAARQDSETVRKDD